MRDTTIAETAPRGRARSARGIRRIRIGIALVAAAAIALGACSHAASEKDMAASASAETAPSASASAKDASAGATVPKGQPLTASRQIVYTAHLQVRVTGVAAASTRAVSVVDGTGGYLFSQDANLQGLADATLVFKVPPARFSEVLDRLGGLGTPLEKDVATSDVTAQVVDLQGRLETATASANRLRTLFATATNVRDIVTVENDLETREAEVESLQGQLRLVKDQVQLATVTLALTTKAPGHKPKPTTTPGFTKALSAGWKAFAGTVRVALAVVGATLPFVTLAAVAAAVVVALRRRRRSPAALDAQGSAV